MSFEAAVKIAYATPELMAEYRRLTGSTLGLDDRSPVFRMIDEAAQHDPWDAEWQPFFEFVREFVWFPLLAAQLVPEEAPR